MKFIHAVSGLVLFLALGALSGLLLYASLLDPSFWPVWSEFLASNRLYSASVGVGLLSALLLYLLSAIENKESAEVVSFDGPGGPITISVKAIRDFVEKVGEEFAAVLSLYPSLSARGGALEVDMDVRVRSGAHIPELCSLLQQRVRETVRDNLGLDEVRAVRINVREIASVDKAPSGQEQELHAPRY